MFDVCPSYAERAWSGLHSGSATGGQFFLSDPDILRREALTSAIRYGGTRCEKEGTRSVLGLGSLARSWNLATLDLLAR